MVRYITKKSNLKKKKDKKKKRKEEVGIYYMQNCKPKHNQHPTMGIQYQIGHNTKNKQYQQWAYNTKLLTMGIQYQITNSWHNTKLPTVGNGRTKISNTNSGQWAYAGE